MKWFLWFLRRGKPVPPAPVPKQQAIRMPAGWQPTVRTDPRPARLMPTPRPENVIPFALRGPEPSPVTAYPEWTEETARKLMLWAQQDANQFRDSGDEQREEGA